MNKFSSTISSDKKIKRNRRVYFIFISEKNHHLSYHVDNEILTIIGVNKKLIYLLA